jgi:hypothetical protein
MTTEPATQASELQIIFCQQYSILGLSFISNRQRRNEGTFWASELAGHGTPPAPKGAGYVRLDHLDFNTVDKRCSDISLLRVLNFFLIVFYVLRGKNMTDHIFLCHFNPRHHLARSQARSGTRLLWAGVDGIDRGAGAERRGPAPRARPVPSPRIWRLAFSIIAFS